MHKLTDNRVGWGLLALLAGALIGVAALWRHGLAQAPAHAWVQANDPRDAFHLVLVGSAVEFGAGIVMLAWLNRRVERPELSGATYVAAALLWLPLVAPVLMALCMTYFGPAWLLLFPLLTVLALRLLAPLVRSHHWAPVLAALIGVTAALVALWGWAGVLSDL